jgi:hypothetical protein
MSIRQRCQPKESGGGGVKSIQDELLAQGEFEPVPSADMHFAKLVACHAEVDLDALILIAPIEAPEERKRNQQQQQAAVAPRSSVFRHYTPLMAGGIQAAALLCHKRGKPVPNRTETPDAAVHERNVAAFAELVGLLIYEKVMKRQVMKMSGAEARRFMNQKLEEIGNQRSIGAALSSSRGSADLAF